MNETYLLFTGQHPLDAETDAVYEVQVRKPQGRKYETRWRFTKHGQAMFHYDCINIGYGFAKRLLRDGKVIRKAAS